MSQWINEKMRIFKKNYFFKMRSKILCRFKKKNISILVYAEKSDNNLAYISAIFPMALVKVYWKDTHGYSVSRKCASFKNFSNYEFVTDVSSLLHYLNLIFFCDYVYGKAPFYLFFKKLPINAASIGSQAAWWDFHIAKYLVPKIKLDINKEKWACNFCRYKVECMGKYSIVVAGGPGKNEIKQDFALAPHRLHDFNIISVNFSGVSLLPSSLRPNAITVADPAIYGGNSDTAVEAIQTVIDLIEQKTYIFCPVSYALRIEQIIGSSDFVIGLETKNLGQYSLLDQSSLVLSTVPIANSLTRYALTIAASVSRKAFIYGADGIDPVSFKSFLPVKTERISAYQYYCIDHPAIYRSKASAVKQSQQYQKYLDEFIAFADEIGFQVFFSSRTFYKNVLLGKPQ